MDPANRHGVRRLVRNAVFGTVWKLTRGMTLGVRGIITDEAGRVLLIRHSYTPGWHFPGGGVERGETVHDALEREVEEEAAVAIDGEARLFAVYSNDANLRGDHVALMVIDVWRSIRYWRPGAEIIGRDFFALDALPDGATPGTRRRLDELFGGAAVSRHW